MAIRRQLALDSSGDLLLDGGLKIIGGPKALAQLAKTKLQTFLGEWVFDTTIGTPWFQSILGRPGDASLIRSILLRRIQSFEGVDRVLRLEVTIDRINRGVSIEGEIQAEGGEEVPISVEVTL